MQMLAQEAKKSDRGHADAEIRLPLVGSDLADHRKGRWGVGGGAAGKENGVGLTESPSSDCGVDASFE